MSIGKKVILISVEICIVMISVRLEFVGWGKILWFVKCLRKVLMKGGFRERRIWRLRNFLLLWLY